MLTLLERPEPWDVIVIGSGVVGGWAARELGRAGLSVLVLQAGPDGPDAPTSPPRVEHMLRTADRLSGDRRVQARIPSYWELDPDLFVSDAEHPFETPPDRPFDWIRSGAVNGRLLTWGGIGVRISDFELAAAEQDGYGNSWPFRYSDLVRHYDDIDRFFSVYGERDGLPQLPDGRYVGAPLLTDAERRLQRAIADNYTDRRVIASRNVLVRPASRPNGEVAPPSPVRAAMSEHSVALRANAVVSHITDGLATGVAFYDRLTKRSHEVSARSVAVCASTLESTRVLLNSRSSHHPTGLGNSSGTLGRYLVDHPALYVSGFASGRRDDAWTDETGGPKNIMIPRFHNLHNDAGGSFLRGYGVFGSVERHRPGRRERPDCGSNEVPFTLVAYGEILARAENRVTISETQKDE